MSTNTETLCIECRWAVRKWIEICAIDFLWSTSWRGIEKKNWKFEKLPEKYAFFFLLLMHSDVFSFAFETMSNRRIRQKDINHARKFSVVSDQIWIRFNILFCEFTLDKETTRSTLKLWKLKTCKWEKKRRWWSVESRSFRKAVWNRWKIDKNFLNHKYRQSHSIRLTSRELRLMIELLSNRKTPPEIE